MLEHKLYKKDNCFEYIVLVHGMGGSSVIFHKQIREFKKKFNVITVHMPGHGNSPSIYSYDQPFSFEIAAKEIISLLEYLGIKKANFIGISLGSVVIHNILKISPQRVKTAILGGVVTRFDKISKLLLTLGSLIKNITPHMWLYRLFANILMPKRNHKLSREAFINEAKKMKRKEFLGWYGIFSTVDSTFKNVHEISKNIPKLYITGQEDHMFKKWVMKDTNTDTNSKLVILNNCGHVVNLDKPQEFNELSISFIDEHTESDVGK